MAYVPISDDRDYVIIFHCPAFVIDSLGGFIIDGWRTWIMEMEIIMMYKLMEMEIPKVTMGYSKSYM
jgi:hypothetical protein